MKSRKLSNQSDIEAALSGAGAGKKKKKAEASATDYSKKLLWKTEKFGAPKALGGPFEKMGTDVTVRYCRGVSELGGSAVAGKSC